MPRIGSDGISSNDKTDLSYDKAYYTPNLVIDNNVLEKTCRISTDGFAFFDGHTQETRSVYDHEGTVTEHGNVLMLGTSGLQSCYPVVLKFKDGSIGLFHANNNSVDSLEMRMKELDINNRTLEEIQIFTKKKASNNSRKDDRAENFFQSLLDHQNPGPLSVQIKAKELLLRANDEASRSLLEQKEQKVAEQTDITLKIENISQGFSSGESISEDDVDDLAKKKKQLSEINITVQNLSKEISALKQTHATLTSEIRDLNKRVVSLDCLSQDTKIHIVENDLDDYDSAVCYKDKTSNRFMVIVASNKASRDIFASKPGEDAEGPITECRFKNSLIPSNLAQSSQATESTTSPILESTTSPILESTTSPILESTTSPIPGSTTSPIPGSTTSPILESTTSPVLGGTTSPIPGNTTSPVPLSQARTLFARFKEALSFCRPKTTGNSKPSNHSSVQPK